MDHSTLEGPLDTRTGQEPVDGGAPDRRELIKIGLAALAGAGVSLLSAPPAYAAVGDAVKLGWLNTADNNSTVIISYTGNATLHLANTGSGVPLRLIPGGGVGAPNGSQHLLGELYTDSTGVLYRILAEGAPATWTRVNSTVLLDAPKRVIDTRWGLGGVEGPLVTGKVYTFPSFFTFAGIPTQAIGLIGNLTMVAPSGKKLVGGAWMAIVPATLPNRSNTPSGYPGVSTINAAVGTDAIANQFTVKVGTGPYDNRISIVKSGSMSLHAVVDIAGYII